MCPEVRRRAATGTLASSRGGKGADILGPRPDDGVRPRVQGRTFDHRAGDVGYVPFARGHCIENARTETLTFPEMFRGPRYADLSLPRWMAPTPHALVRARTNVPMDAVDGLPTRRSPVVPG